MSQINLIRSKSRGYSIPALTVNGLRFDLVTAADQTFPLEKYLVYYWTVEAPPTFYKRWWVGTSQNYKNTYCFIMPAARYKVPKCCLWEHEKFPFIRWCQEKEREPLFQTWKTELNNMLLLTLIIRNVLFLTWPPILTLSYFKTSYGGLRSDCIHWPKKAGIKRDGST